MTQYAIVTDLNRCVGCLACSSACKTVSSVPIGNFWIKVLRIGPNKAENRKTKGSTVESYFLPIQCQHCVNPACVSVCPTEASHKLADGSVQVDKEKCIGCQFCAMACPYGVRYLNEEERVVEKCTLCEQRTAQGELPQCVAQCSGRARWFGDIDAGWDSFEGPADPASVTDPSYEGMQKARAKMTDYVVPFTDADVHRLTDVGNQPSVAYILRGRNWHGQE